MQQPCCALALSKLLNQVIPVTLPPGRLRLATRPSWTGSPPDVNNNQNSGGRRHGRQNRCTAFPSLRSRPPLRPTQIGHQCRQSIALIFRKTVFDRHVAASDVADLVQAFAEPGR